jgi:asparagine synthase (glutamine-hydrolysing)
LFLACDEMGVKPLYFDGERDRFTFASELKALVAGRRAKPSLDVVALSRYLGFQWSPGGATPLAGVSRLGPGEALRVKDGSVVKRWRWANSAWTGLPPIDGDAISRVASGLRTAVQRQMVADVRVGAFLSGGLDSSAVVAMARELAPQIECFTIDTGHERDAGVPDDLPYARRVADHLGVRLREVRVDSSCMAANLERMIFQLDEPLADPAPLHVLQISRLAREHGVKVLLSGAGGDDLFTGYRRHRALMLERYWTWTPRGVQRQLRTLASCLGHRSALGRRLNKAFSHVDSPRDERLTGYFLWADPHRIRDLFSAHYRDSLSHEELLAPLREYLRTLPPDLPALQRMLALEQRFFLADHNLLYTDKMSMASGVEVRVPFLDPDLVRLANALPASLKQRGVQGKWVLKKAMEPYLPHDVIYRPKAGFGAPLRRWLRGELRDWIADILSADTLRRRGLFDAEAVTALVADDRAGRVDGAYTIFGLACIEVWCQNFIDRIPIAANQ